MIYFYNPDNPSHVVVWDRYVKNDRVASKLLTYYRKHGFKGLVLTDKDSVDSYSVPKT